MDCGRKMGEIFQKRTRLDHSLGAATQLASAVAHQKDSFSFIAFSNKIEQTLPQLRGQQILARLLPLTSQLQVRMVESDYWQVVGRALLEARKRSLVVFFTDLVDSAGSAGMQANLAKAARQHVVLLVVMKDKALEELPAGKTLEEAFELAAACWIRQKRAIALAEIRSRGVMVLEVAPDRFGPQVIEQYLNLREVI